MNYKIEGAIRRNKNRFIIFAILWLFMAIVIVMPIGYSQYQASINGNFDFGVFINTFVSSYSNFGGVIGNIASYFGIFFGWLWKFTIVYAIFMFVGFVRTAPKNEYTDIEQGSSDWASRTI